MPRVYELAFKYLLIISIPIAGGIFLTADKLAQLLYGPEFAPVGSILTVMIWVIPWAFISEFLRHILLVVNREGSAVRALVVAVMVNIGLNLWLIPDYGFMAAAIVALIAEMVLVTIYAWQLKDELSSVRLNTVLLKLILASSIFMLMVYKLASLSLVLQVGISGLAYLLILWLLGIVKPNEYEALFDSIKYPKRQLSNRVITMPEVKSPNLVSVFILTYNTGQFLAQAIESVLNQTYQNFELIIIDDCSTDDTAQILHRYQTHPQVRIYHNLTNLGISPSWNIALRLCQGEFIAKLDADDFYEPGQLETVVAFFEEHPEAGLVFSGLTLIHPDGHQEIEVMFPHSWVRPRESFLSILLDRCIIRAPTVFVRRVCYEKLGGVVEEMKLHSDWEMWVRVAANYPVGYIARRLASYRLSYGSNSTAKAITDGRSLHDLRLWLNLLAEDKLPYRLSENELTRFRWGLYDLVMHFAGIAAYHQQEAMAKVYTAFAEELLLPCRPTSNMERLRHTHLNLHQGIYAFQSHQHKKAIRYFLKALKIKGGSLPEVWHELGLTLKIIRRLSAGFYRRIIIKYYSGL